MQTYQGIETNLPLSTFVVTSYRSNLFKHFHPTLPSRLLSCPQKYLTMTHSKLRKRPVPALILHPAPPDQIAHSQVEENEKW
jgi:hypothetical protein